MPVLNVSLIIVAYLLGSISTALLVCRIGNLQDPRTLGSGNPGATNVLRTGSKGAAAITLLGDILKGLIPVLIAKALDFGDIWLAAVALAAFIGHLFPLYYGFKGGKGVATALGVTLGTHWVAGLLVMATWLFVALVTRISSLSALVAACAMPILIYWLTGSAWLGTGFTLIAVIIVIKHHDNIRRILNGTESSIGKSSDSNGR